MKEPPLEMDTPAERASFARPYWNAATRHGTPDATTTFHDRYNKHDYHYSYGGCGGFVRQDGPRGMALGYLTKVRFMRFLSTPLAKELTGIDLTKPGQGAEQAARVIEVADEFFQLLVDQSVYKPFRDDDYGNVSRSRKLPHGSFCIFTGFQEALASRELKALRKTWKARYTARVAPPPPTESAPAQDWTQHPAYNAEFERLNTEAVEEVNAEIAAQHPPTPPRPAYATCPDIVDEEALAKFMATVYRAATYQTGLGGFGASGHRVQFDEPLFFVQRNMQRRGPNRDEVRVTLVPKAALRKRLRVRALRSEREIHEAFARPRRRNN